jgi:hypothetical protein
VRLPFDAAGVVSIAAHVEKLSPESCRLPVHAVPAVDTVMLEGRAGVEKVTEIDGVVMTSMAPSAGVVAETPKPIAVEKPAAVVKSARSGFPLESVTPVVTRIL